MSDMFLEIKKIIMLKYSIFFKGFLKFNKIKVQIGI